MRHLTICLVCLFASFPCLASVGVWRVNNATISNMSDAHSLHVNAIDETDGLSVALNVTVPLETISSSFVVGDRFVVLGEAGRAQAAVILNLRKQSEEDWFFCYEPRRINDIWIVYVEYYPSQGADEPTDVVLLYDVTAGPEHNRLPQRPGSEHVNTRYPIEVGIPIFPEWNVSHHSYNNTSRDAVQPYHVLGPPFFTYVAPNRIAFVVTQGRDMSDYHNALAVVDLSGTTGEASNRIFAFPMNELPRTGERPNYLQVDAVKQTATNKLDIEISETTYGVKVISMDIH